MNQIREENDMNYEHGSVERRLRIYRRRKVQKEAFVNHELTKAEIKLWILWLAWVQYKWLDNGEPKGPRGSEAFRNSWPEQASQGGLEIVFNQQARASVLPHRLRLTPSAKITRTTNPPHPIMTFCTALTAILWANFRIFYSHIPDPLKSSDSNPHSGYKFESELLKCRLINNGTLWRRAEDRPKCPCYACWLSSLTP